MKRKVYVVLPVYNEESNIGKLLDSIEEAMYDMALPYKIIIVDDGSYDKTGMIVSERFTRMPILIKEHKINLGLGATIRDGLYEATELAADRDIIVTMDADDTHAPGLILRMVRMISEGYDVVIASRYQQGARTIGVPLSRRFLSYSASLLFRIFFPTLGIRDFTCGYRAYRAEVIKEAINQYGENFLDQDGFQCTVDILLKLSKMNLIFGEVPIILRYDFKVGKSKMKLARTSRKTLQLIFKRRFGG
jgi:dolichol-phosphate mannosyltransferase